MSSKRPKVKLVEPSPPPPKRTFFAVMLDFFRYLFAILWLVLTWLWRALRWLGIWLYRFLRWAVPPAARWTRSFVLWLLADRKRFAVALLFIAVAGMYVAYRAARFVQINSPINEHNDVFSQWFEGDPALAEKLMTIRNEPCPGAPFLLPANGFIGLYYADPRLPYSETHRHQGIDIFSPNDEPGKMPVVAAYDGYITRRTYWLSAMIERVPDDPLHPGRQIWLYYTHMAPADGSFSYIVDAFPLGSEEIFVKQGTLLGYTGNYAGAAGGISTHLHFSIVLDDGSGSYSNELYFENTVDSSRYLGMPVNYACAPNAAITCSSDPLCPEAILSAGGS